MGGRAPTAPYTTTTDREGYHEVVSDALAKNTVLLIIVPAILGILPQSYPKEISSVLFPCNLYITYPSDQGLCKVFPELDIAECSNYRVSPCKVSWWYDRGLSSYFISLKSDRLFFASGILSCNKSKKKLCYYLQGMFNCGLD